MRSLKLAVSAILFSFLVIGCSGTKQKGSETEEVIITLQKTMCRGACPVYKLEVYNTGKLILEGKENLDLIGTYISKLSNDDFKELTSAFEKAEFNSFEEEYTSRRTDLPTTFLTYEGKRVKNYDNAPEVLKELENKIETLIESQKWEVKT